MTPSPSALSADTSAVFGGGCLKSKISLLVVLFENVYDPSRGSRSTLYSATKPHAPTSDQCRRDDFFERSVFLLNKDRSYVDLQ